MPNSNPYVDVQGRSYLSSRNLAPLASLVTQFFTVTIQGLEDNAAVAIQHHCRPPLRDIPCGCCFAPINLLITVNNHTAMIDAVLTQSLMPVTIIITAVQQHPFWPLPQDRCGCFVTWLIISLRRMPYTCLSFQQLRSSSRHAVPLTSLWGRHTRLCHSCSRVVDAMSQAMAAQRRRVWSQAPVNENCAWLQRDCGSARPLIMRRAISNWQLTSFLALNVGDPATAAGWIQPLTRPMVWARLTEGSGLTSGAYCTFVTQVLDINNTIANPAIHRMLMHYDNLTGSSNLCICTRLRGNVWA